MPHPHQIMLPSILIPHFDGGKEILAAAGKLLGLGYPCIAACKNNQAAESARSLGCATTEACMGGLRAGLEYYRAQIDGKPGILIFDPEDGYSTDDVIRVADAFQANPGKVVLACRQNNTQLGRWDRFARKTAALAFTVIHGRKVSDPWASLMALPSRHVPGFLRLDGEGAMLHFNILLNLQQRDVGTVNVPVGAVYAYGAGSGLGSRIFDSLKILLLPLKFLSASVASTLADYSVFGLFGYVFFRNELVLTIVAGRFAGAVTGYLLNKNVVFKHKNKDWKRELKSAAQFALLAGVNCLIALVVIDYLIKTFNLYVIVTKIIADVILFVSNYLIQRDFIFRRKTR